MTALQHALKSDITRASFHALEGDPALVPALVRRIDARLAELDPLAAPRLSGEIGWALHVPALPGAAVARHPLLRMLQYRRRARRERLVREIETARRTLPARFPGLAWPLTCDRDGFVRGAAVRALAPPAPSAFHLALLLTRTNDWVEPIRALALARLPEFWRAAEPADRVTLALLLLDPRRFGRVGADRPRLEALTAPPLAREELIQDLSAQDGRLSARLFALLLRQPWVDPHLPGLAAKSPAPLVRARALAAVANGRVRWRTGRRLEATGAFQSPMRWVAVHAERPVKAPESAIGAAVRRGLEDRAASVRRVAAQALIDRPALFPDRLELAGARLADPSRAVAERACFVLRREGEAGRSTIAAAAAQGDRHGLLAAALAAATDAAGTR